LSSEPQAAPAATDEGAGSAGPANGGPARRKRAHGIPFKILIPAVVALDVLAFMLVPPFPKGGHEGQACSYPTCFIESVVELPPPAVVWDLAPSAESGPPPMFYFHPSISSSILTMWLVMAAILLLAIATTRGMKMTPGRVQNAVEWIYEFGRDFTVGIGGERARRYYPVFAAFFLLIVFSNWSGLVPPIGRVENLRAPTSDVNITIGLALTSFVMFQGEGFRRLGVRGYLGKFFPIGEFRHGMVAGLLAMYVGLVELFLEFVKPVTLAMRLFGNIYGGEVALAVITALTISILPVALVGLEALLNVIQALIFSVLTLMFILIAIESHGDEEHEPATAGETANGAPGGVHPKPAAA
jgi:F-type H+-transporting ATPase subunit a